MEMNKRRGGVMQNLLHLETDRSHLMLVGRVIRSRFEGKEFY